MYNIGWGRRQIAVKAQGYAMMGYGMWHNRAHGHDSPLFARALYLEDQQGGGSLVFCCLDLGYVTHAMRSGVIETLRQRMGGHFNEAAFVLTCTHTHSGPGGCTHDAMYNLVTPGFVPDNLEQVVVASVEAIVDAWQQAAPAEFGLAEGRFADRVPVAWNRSLPAYNRNPDVVPRPATQAHLALDRAMRILTIRRGGQLQSLLSLFGVHATCIGGSLDKYSGDNKGYAAMVVEEQLRVAGASGPVAIFAQATAGDVSPHYHGPGDVARRRKITGDAEYAYAQQNGSVQAEQAMAIVEGAGELAVRGGIDAIFSYVDFTRINADPRFANGNEEACTSEPCHGVSFFAGTRVDGPGMPAALAFVARNAAQGVKDFRLRNIDKYTPADQAYYRRLYAAQGPKHILLEAGRKRLLGQPLDRLPIPGFADPLVDQLKRQAGQGAITQSALVPTILPLQIIVLGQLALVCCPGEFTTMAGQRLVRVVADALQPRGIEHVLICTYCNDYMGYVTTCEEYQEQAYEGGHTIYGQWTLAAFQTRFEALAREMLRPVMQREHDQATRPQPVPVAELSLRSNLPVPRRA